MTTPSYPLTRDGTEHERLAAQAAFWAPEAAALIEVLDLPSGARAADLGCGTLQVAELLLRAVGPQGQVQALDSDAALVAALRGHASIAVEEGDAFSTGWPDGSLHAVHARFLAAPAGRLPALVAEMHRLLAAGGVALLQEPDADSWDISGAGAAWPTLRTLIRAGFRARGGNFDAGLQLAAALKAQGFVEVQQRRVVRQLPPGHAYAALPLAFAKQLRPLWLAEGLVGEDELDALLSTIASRLAAGAESTTFTLVQCWGHRGQDQAAG